LDIEVSPSAKTRAALDIALRNVLEQISRRNVRYLGIHATDIGDAIFLARKVRDVAPDVRLAFFGADAHLLHAKYRRELLGSLVISPYPFLGVNNFAAAPSAHNASGVETLRGFESDNAEALYNATLVQRGAGPELLSNYVFGRMGDNATASNSGTLLPIWISTVGREQFVPLRARPALDCKNVVFRGDYPKPSSDLCAAETTEERRRSWVEFNTLRSVSLPLGSDTSLPHTWDLLFCVLLLGFWIDTRLQTQTARRFVSEPFPPSVSEGDDQLLDRAIGRTKWRFYSAIRTFLFGMAFLCIGSVYLLALVARGDSWQLSQIIGNAAVFLAVSASVICTKRTVLAFWDDYGAFARCVGAHRVPRSIRDMQDAMRPSDDAGWTASQTLVAGETSNENWVTSVSNGQVPLARSRDSSPASTPRIAQRISMGLGMASQPGRQAVAHTSFAQLRLLAVLAAISSAAFTMLLILDTVDVADWSLPGLGVAVPALTFSVLRNTSLGTGVAPSTPALLCMACVYIWAVGRMARLSLAHSTSRCSPVDGTDALVSTPIRLILHPGFKSGRTPDDGFTAVERNVLNSIWRPILGYRVVAALTMAAFPVLLFLFKPLSTLEGLCGTLLLGGGLVLCVFLIGVTLLQLDQYWRALKDLLKRTREHPLGPAFKTLPPFARDSVDHQVSRSPNELLRWAGCARAFAALIASSRVPMLLPFLEAKRPILETKANEIARLRILALSLNVGPQAPSTERPLATEQVDRPSESMRYSVDAALAEANLAEQLILAASAVTEILERAWRSDFAKPAKSMSAAWPAALEREAEERRTWVGGRFSQLSTAVGAEYPQSTLRGEDIEAMGTAGHVERVVPSESGFPPAPARPLEVVVRVERESAESKPRSDDGAPPIDDALAPVAFQLTSDELRWLRSAQTFVATVVAILIHRHVRQFRYFLHVLTGCSLLLLLAVTSYAFEPYRLLLTFIWIVVGSVVTMCLWTFIQMDRNTLMSNIAGKSPERLTLNAGLVVRVVPWTLIPLLSVAAAQYPELASFLYGLIKPFVGVLH
jgi:hypothetical protein